MFGTSLTKPGSLPSQMSHEGWFKRGSILTASLAAALLLVVATPAAHAQSATYTVDYSGGQLIVPAYPAAWETLIEFEVADAFDVTSLSIAIDMFAWNVNALDIRLTSPSGTVYKFLDNRCGGVALAFGRRGFPEIAVGDGSDIVSGGETTATYTFSDDALIALGGGTNSGSWCDDIWQNPDPGNSGYDDTLPWIHSNSGSWTMLPAGAYLPSPGQGGSFAGSFAGEPALGTWRLEFREWLGGTTFLSTSDWASSPYAPGPTVLPIINGASIIFNYDGEIEPNLETFTQSLVQNFMVSRATTLLVEDLDLEERLTNRNAATSGQNSVVVTSDTADVELAFSFIDGINGGNPARPYDVWADISYHWNEDPTGGEFSSLMAHFGYDYLVNENLLLGVLATIDHAEQDAEDSTSDQFGNVEGSGWLVGPYVVARLSENVLFNGRLQYGRSDNSVEVTSGGLVYTGDFNTDRFLAHAEISGEFEVGTATHAPYFSVAYTTDETDGPFVMQGSSGPISDSYTVDQIHISEGRTTFGYEVRWRFEDSGFLISPSLELAGVWQFDAPDYVSSTGTVLNSGSSDPFLRLEAGIQIRDGNGFSFGFDVTHEGLGSANTDNLSASLSLNFAF